VYFLYWLIFQVHRLDLWLIGLGGTTNLPAIPIQLSALPDTAFKLLTRARQMEQAIDALATRWTIGGVTANAYRFMGMEDSDAKVRAVDPYTRSVLETPDQFALSWTTLGGIEENATKNWLNGFVASLSSAEDATWQFWPTIAKYGAVFNLIILQRVDPGDSSYRNQLGPAWTAQMQAVWQAGNLYAIDMTFFAQFDSHVVNFVDRFTPGTLTFLERTPATRAINPFAICVSDSHGASVWFRTGDPAWIYALQAAKASITVWGIWIGHVYHWHIVTAAMQMTMFQNLDAQHPVSQVFGRQSDYLIGFDEFLLLDWSVAPPTSVTTGTQFLQMIDAFAAGRNFFDDDPLDTITRLKLREEDFGEGWADYPVVRNLFALYRSTNTYVTQVVTAFYGDEAAVASDTALQNWISASADPGGGNVRGLPRMTTRAALIKVLASLIYRVTAHGCGRLNQTANPVLSFTANFPPCLQNKTIPPANTTFVFNAGPNPPPGTASLAGYLPNTGTIGEMVTFLFTFSFSPPYVPFIPLTGVDAQPPFTGSAGEVAMCEAALSQFRADLENFISQYAADYGVQGAPAQIHQWPLNIET
jgi:hypothetical protein